MGAYNKLFQSRHLQKFRTSLSTFIIDRTQQDKTIMKPFDYIYKVPAKYYRIGPAFNYWLQAPEDKLNVVEDIVRTLHTASLLMDDIQDNSKLRYGIPAAHHIHGIGSTINAASNAFAIALKKVLELEHPMAANIYCETVLEGHRGQGMELFWRDNFICPTEEEYIDMLRQKASVFFILTTELLQLFCKRKGDLNRIANLFGVYYSVRDDYCNLFNPKALKILSEGDNKSDSEEVPDNDITDGKFTLPIIHALKDPEGYKQIIDILKQRTSDPILINHCTTLMKNLGCDKYTEDKLRTLESDIHKEISRLGGNPILTTFMKELENWRRHKQRAVDCLNLN